MELLNLNDTTTIDLSLAQALATENHWLNTHPMWTRFKDSIIKIVQCLYLIAQIVLETEPTCFTDAVKHEEWRKAIFAEFQALQN